MSVDLGAIREAGRTVGLIDQRILAIANRVFNRRLEGLRLQSRTLDLEWLIDGGTSAIVAPLARRASFDFPVRVVGVSLFSDPLTAAGTLTVVIRRYPWDNYTALGQVPMSPLSAAAGTPALSASSSTPRQFRDTALTSWSAIDIPAGDVLELAVTQAATLTNATLTLKLAG
jgi:hypothetical protein